MTELEQLSKRIEQLAVAIKTGNEAIKSMETALKAAQEERNSFLEQEPKFERVKEKERYYFIDLERFRGFVVISDTEDNYSADEALYNNNNYYHTKQRAQEVADKFNFLLKLERFHDMFCPDYKPNWNSDERKHYVFYSHNSECYSVGSVGNSEYKTNVFFPTLEIAEKVCDILNKELEEKI